MPVLCVTSVDLDVCSHVLALVSCFRALIPPEQGYSNCNLNEPQPPTFATKRQLINYCKGPLLFEIALLRVVTQA